MPFNLKPSKFGRLQNWQMKREKRKKKNNRETSVGQAEDVRQIWDLHDKESYVRPPRMKRLPQLLLSLAVFAFLSASIFWLLPELVERYYLRQNAAPEVAVPDMLYEPGTLVVTSSFTNLMQEPRAGSERITQLLFNEPLQVLQHSSDEDFLHVMTLDGVRGYVLQKETLQDASSIEPNLYKYKLIISDPVKRVMTHATKGTLRVEVMMNTILFSDFKGDGVYRVSLPGGGNGWIGSNGIIELGALEPLEKVGVRYFISSVESFHYVTHIAHGVTQRGASIEGVVYVCAGINGLRLPRKMEEQFTAGEEVLLRYDAVTQVLNLSSLLPGDLLFFRSPADPDSDIPYEMGVYTDTGMVLMNHTSRTSIRICDLANNAELKSRIIAARRIFS